MAEQVTRQKALSLKMAQKCEQAQEPVCKCRCGGTGHGRKRNGEGTPDLSFFNGLPEDDPHYIPSAEKKREMLNARKREETRLRQEKIAAAWKKLYEK